MKLEELRPKTTLFHYGTYAVRYAKFFQSLGQPFAIHFNGYDLSSRVRDPRYASELKETVNAASHLIVVADYMGAWLIDHGVPPERIHNIAYGVPIDEFGGCEPVSGNIQQGRLCQFLIVGRLTSKKLRL